MSSSVLGSYPGHHRTSSCHVSLGFSWLWQFLRLPLGLMTLTVLGSTPQVCFRMLLHWNISDVFLMIRLELFILGRKDDRGKEPFWPHHIKGAYCRCGYWSWPSDWGSVCQVFRDKVMFFSPPFPDCVLWKEVTLHNPPLRRKSYSLPLGGGLEFVSIIWNSYVRETCLFSLIYLFNCFFISVDSWDIYFTLWVSTPILLYFVAQIVPALSTGNSLNWLLWYALWPSPNNAGCLFLKTSLFSPKGYKLIWLPAPVLETAISPVRREGLLTHYFFHFTTDIIEAD